MNLPETLTGHDNQFQLVSQQHDPDGHYFREWIRIMAAQPPVTFETEAETSHYEQLKGTYPEPFARRLVKENWRYLGETGVTVADIAPSSQFGAQKGFAKVIFLEDQLLLYVSGKHAHEIKATVIEEFRSRQISLTSRSEVISGAVEIMSRIAGASTPKVKTNTLEVHRQATDSSHYLRYLVSLKLAITTDATDGQAPHQFMDNASASERVLVDLMNV